MSNQVYKMIEVAGTSSESLDDAIRGAIARTAKTVRSLRWFKVIETRGHIKADQVHEFQVILQIGFAIHDED